MMENLMFCSQCQETAANRGCTRVGLCGKKPAVAAMQDLLLHATKGLACAAVRLRKDKMAAGPEVDRLISANLRAASTNVDFDEEDLRERIGKTFLCRDGLLSRMTGGQREKLPETAFFTASPEEYEEKAKSVGVLATEDEDVRSLRSFVTAGLKGLAGLLGQANALGAESEEIDDFVQRALVDLQNDGMTGGNLLALVMETGRFGIKAFELLDETYRERFGAPKASEVALGVKDRPAILVSGCDLSVLEQVLRQTEDTGVDVYTHGDLLHAHACPELAKYPQLAGQYGGSWWEQKEEFESFHGPVIVAGDGLVPPRDSYASRLYTAGGVRWPGIACLEPSADGSLDLSEVIAKAKTCAAPAPIAEGSVTTGYDNDQVLAMAFSLVDAIQAGSLGKFAVIAGADGRAKTRGYYNDFVQRLPADTLVFTAGSVKYRFPGAGMGEIDGIPRVLDLGGIDSSWSLIQIAMKLSEALEESGMQRIPFIWNISWYDQKSLLLLMALFYLDIKNVHIGPTLPGFLTPVVADILKKYFGISEIGNVDRDIERFFGRREDVIHGDMIVSDIVEQYPQLVPAMLGEGLHCITCGVSKQETLDEACQVHGLDTNHIIQLLNDTLTQGA